MQNNDNNQRQAPKKGKFDVKFFLVSVLLIIGIFSLIRGLTQAGPVVLSYSEFLTHISRVKLGAMLGMIEIANISDIDDLIIKVRPASLCETHGKKLSKQSRDLFRAEIVGTALSKMKG